MTTLEMLEKLQVVHSKVNNMVQPFGPLTQDEYYDLTEELDSVILALNRRGYDEGVISHPYSKYYKQLSNSKIYEYLMEFIRKLHVSIKLHPTLKQFYIAVNPLNPKDDNWNIIDEIDDVLFSLGSVETV